MLETRLLAAASALGGFQSPEVADGLDALVKVGGTGLTTG
jgi:hypothetical protein